MIDTRTTVTAHGRVDIADFSASMAGVGNATRLERVRQVQRSAVNRQALNAANKIITVDLTGSFLDGLHSCNASQIHGVIAKVKRSET